MRSWQDVSELPGASRASSDGGKESTSPHNWCGLVGRTRPPAWALSTEQREIGAGWSHLPEAYSNDGVIVVAARFPDQTDSSQMCRLRRCVKSLVPGGEDAHASRRSRYANDHCPCAGLWHTPDLLAFAAARQEGHAHSRAKCGYGQSLWQSVDALQLDWQ